MTLPVECCGFPRQSKFCPDCGNRLQDPLQWLFGYLTTLSEVLFPSLGNNDKNWPEAERNMVREAREALIKLIAKQSRPGLNDGLSGLELGPRIEGRLIAVGVATIADLLKLSEDDLRIIPGIGRSAVAMILEAIGKYDYALATTNSLTFQGNILTSVASKTPAPSEPLPRPVEAMPSAEDEFASVPHQAVTHLPAAETAPVPGSPTFQGGDISDQ